LKQKVSLLCIFLLVGIFSLPSYAQIKIDGDSTDWAAEPVLITAPDNLQDYFPSGSNALISDRVDVKEVKARVDGNILYFYIKFWQGPCWPNYAYTETDTNGIESYRHRGYYHLEVDLDNDPTTGWDTYWYEASFTPLGYRNDQGEPNTDRVGSEGHFYWGTDNRWTAPKEDGGVKYVEYTASDMSETEAQIGPNTEYYIMTLEQENPDTNTQKLWQGTLYSAEDTLDTRRYWAGHAWGEDFLEYGIEITAVKEYWKAKGLIIPESGGTIGIAAFIETPVDNWGIDMTPRGELILPPMSERPSSITFDGDDSDWAGSQVLINAPDNIQDYFPSGSNALISDRVDIKEIKAFANLEEDALYWLIRFWQGPCWPNYAYTETDTNGIESYRHRGYYHLELDLDNDPTTGWDTYWYEASFTPLGYRNDQGEPNTDKVGSEGHFYWGTDNRWTPPKEDGGVKYIELTSSDMSETEAQIGPNTEYYIMTLEADNPDSSRQFRFDGYAFDAEADSALVGTSQALHWAAHAWGEDFLEMGMSLGTTRAYWQAKGQDYLKVGDVIGIAGFIETPVDNWGIDMTPRGQLTLTLTDISDNQAVLADKFILENNYPNPFNPETTIKYYIPKYTDVSLVIYNTLGQKVRTLVDGKSQAGQYTVKWNGRNDSGQSLGSGIYFYKLKSESVSITKRMVLLK
jgi:hypothetical protein